MRKYFICTWCHSELTSQPEYYAGSSHLTDTHLLTLNKKSSPRRWCLSSMLVNQYIFTYNIKKISLCIFFWSKATIFVIAPQLYQVTAWWSRVLAHSSAVFRFQVIDQYPLITQYFFGVAGLSLQLTFTWVSQSNVSNKFDVKKISTFFKNIS